MNEIKTKIDRLVSTKVRQLPRRNTLTGLMDNMKKKSQLIPRLERDINSLIADYQKQNTFSDSEKLQLRNIVKSAIQKFMAA